MKLVPLLAVAGVLAVAGGASALGSEPIEVLDVIYENATSLGACVGTSAQGSVGVSVTSDPPAVVVTTPLLDPPGPECLVLPAP